ncbi:hypothetical protein RSAG8_14018, partial [Rhizoctonia solani AG-8 WAC10335]
MAEEQTVLCFTKLNSPDRAKQNVAMIGHMTQIKQHELQELDQLFGFATFPIISSARRDQLVIDWHVLPKEGAPLGVVPLV